MAVYRYIHTSFWDDAKVQDNMTPIERYFMLYLLTNSHTRQCGVYEISKKQMSFESDIDTEQLQKLLDRFENELNVIKYDDNTKEVLITNWYKYNWTASEKVKKCILNEVKDIKSNELLDYINRVCMPYIYPNDTLSIPNNKEKEKEKQKEKEEKNKNNNANNSCADGLQKLIDFYNNNIGMITPYGMDILSDYLKEMPADLIILAMKKSVEANKRTIQYIKGILNNWSKKGIKNVIDAESEDKNYENRKTNSNVKEEFLKEHRDEK